MPPNVLKPAARQRTRSLRRFAPANVFPPSMGVPDFGAISPVVTCGGVGTFDTKQLEVYAVSDDGGWLAITAIVKFF
jgi:hypothetical protein